MVDPVFQAVTELTNLYLDADRNRYVIGFPKNANIAADTIGKFAQSEKADDIALIHEYSDGSVENYSFAELDDMSSRFAIGLQKLGVAPAEPIAINTAQGPQTAIAHMAVYKLGAVALTISHRYGPDAVVHVLEDAKARIIITHADYWSNLRQHCCNVTSLEHRIVYGDFEPGEIPFNDCLATLNNGFEPVVTATDDPAILMYTSGSTGKPKGIFHAHRLMYSYTPGLMMVYNLELNYPNAVYWTPSDWAWVGGWLDIAVPAWQHGQCVVSSNQRFEAESAFELMQRHQVTHTFLPPTALKRLAQISNPRERWELALRVISTGGESLPAETLRWAEEDLNVVCNEFYGMTEFTDMIGCCKRLFPTKPGSMGRAFPGHQVAIIDNSGNELPDGEIGEIAVGYPGEPCLFLGYRGQSELPPEMIINGWLRSGDLAVRDEDGYYWYKGRADDLILSSGYRIGPNEVEETLMKHPYVAEAAVIGKPDSAHGEIVFAFVRLMNDVAKDDATKAQLKEFVKTNLALYKYPRQIEFVDDFPMTSTGKIQRFKLRQKVASLPP